MLRVENISKIIKKTEILHSMSFEIEGGECVALIGQNGAGKTSLFNCLLGDWKVTTGKVLIDGQTPTSAENKEKIAVLKQENRVPEGLKVKELIAFFQLIYEDHLSEQEISDLLAFSDRQYQQLAEKLSGGQKRLLAFVLCLIGKPKLLFLDEPTAGMDTSTRKRFWEIVQRLKSKGVTILYSSHYIEEVEHTADRILVLHQGRLLQDTTPMAMRRQEATKEVTIPLDYKAVVMELPAVEKVELQRDFIRFETHDIESVWSALLAAGCSISDMELQNKTLLNTLFDRTRGEES